MRMTGYTKLFGSIITSTIWREKNETRILWITMLAMKNKAGIVEGSVPGLADMARLSVEDTVAALEILRTPDPYSRTKEHEGRRIKDVDGGWIVLNHEKWREKMNADERREYLRIKQQEHRAKVNKSVNKRKQTSTQSTHTDTEPYTDKEEEYRYPSDTSEGFKVVFKKWEGFRKGLGKKPKDWRAMFQEQLDWLGCRPASDRVEILNQSIRNGWQGLFELKGGQYGTNQKHTSESSRNVGTANEGKSSQYKGVGKIV